MYKQLAALDGIEHHCSKTCSSDISFS